MDATIVLRLYANILRKTEMSIYSMLYIGTLISLALRMPASLNECRDSHLIQHTDLSFIFFHYKGTTQITFQVPDCMKCLNIGPVFCNFLGRQLRGSWQCQIPQKKQYLNA